MRSGAAVPPSRKATPSQFRASLFFMPQAICTAQSPSFASKSLGPSAAPDSAGLLAMLCGPSSCPLSLHLLGCVPHRSLFEWILLCSSRSGGQATGIGIRLTWVPGWTWPLAGCVSSDNSLCFSEHGVLSHGGTLELEHGIIGGQSWEKGPQASSLKVFFEFLEFFGFSWLALGFYLLPKHSKANWKAFD